MFWLLFFVLFGCFSYFAWSSVFWFSQLQYGWQQQNDYECSYDYDQKYQQVMHWSQIREQDVFVLSAVCKYNTMVVYAWFFRKKTVFS
jgi:hypothetical protein